MITPNSPSITIRDVARRAGVSVATVSRVINKTGTVSPDTCARVQATIDELHFVPRAAAQSLSNRRTNVIGLLLADIGWDNFFPPMLRGIESGSFEAGFDLLIHSIRFMNANPPFHLPVGEHNTDGLLIFINSLPDAEIVRLYQKGFPLVLLHRSPPSSLAIPHVVFENKAGARAITDHLIEVHGCRRIAFLAGPEGNEDSQWREQGYREALVAHGLTADRSLIRRGEFDEEIAQRTVAQWLAEGFEGEAIFAADDDSAYGVLRALQQAGKRVPEEIMVVGFDDAPTSRLITPPLTTVGAPIEQSGYQAARLLSELIRTGQTAPKVLLPTQIIIRHSCGCNG